jgi:hypothetical protein
MPRRLRLSTGGIAYHVLNRGVGPVAIIREARRLLFNAESLATTIVAEHHGELSEAILKRPLKVGPFVAFSEPYR